MRKLAPTLVAINRLGPEPIYLGLLNEQKNAPQGAEAVGIDSLKGKELLDLYNAFADSKRKAEFSAKTEGIARINSLVGSGHMPVLDADAVVETVKPAPATAAAAAAPDTKKAPAPKSLAAPAKPKPAKKPLDEAMQKDEVQGQNAEAKAKANLQKVNVPERNKVAPYVRLMGSLMRNPLRGFTKDEIKEIWQFIPPGYTTHLGAPDNYMPVLSSLKSFNYGKSGHFGLSGICKGKNAAGETVWYYDPQANSTETRLVDAERYVAAYEKTLGVSLKLPEDASKMVTK